MNSIKKEDITDIEIIERYLDSQSDRYFDVLYDRYSIKVYSKVISLLKDEILAQDVTQEIFLKIFKNLSRFSAKSKFSTWVYSITYNTCMDALRKSKRKNILSEIDEEKVEEVVEEVDDQEILEVQIDRLKVVLDELPVNDKALLLMKYQDDMSIRDISEVISKSESAVKMQIKRAKAKFVKIHKLQYKIGA